MTATSTTDQAVRVIHAVWDHGRLCVWGEQTPTGEPARDAAHPFAARVEGVEGAPTEIALRLPSVDGAPLPSRALSYDVGETAQSEDPEIRSFVVPAVALHAEHAERVLDRIVESAESGGAQVGSSVEFFAVVARFARHLIAKQRFVPMICQDGAGTLTASWRPWLADEHIARQASLLAGSMPRAAAASEDAAELDAWGVVDAALTWIVNAACRRVLIDEDMTDTIEDAEPKEDAQVAWLGGLLDSSEGISITGTARTDLVRAVRRWIGGLEDRGESSTWRLGLSVNEPLSDKLPDDLSQPTADVQWSISFFLESLDDENIRVDAADVWLLSRDSVVIEGLTLEDPQELLLKELGRASRHYKKLESALEESEPIEVLLETAQAYEFLREIRPVLLEQGFAVEAPLWWNSPAGRLGARLRVSGTEDGDGEDGSTGASPASDAQLGLGALVNYHWEIAIGQTTLSLHEFEEFASKAAPLVRLDGKWVEIRPEDVQHAIQFIRENPGGQMELGEALRLAYAADPRETGVAVLGLEAEGWIASFLGAEGETVSLPELDTPDTFLGTLRPYQARGLSWLAFMEKIGFGACLADDMGLGKTVQLLALLAFEREKAKQDGTGRVPPTLLVVPMSVVGNWERELRRFTPTLDVMIHHGPERLMDAAFVERVNKADVVVTTYALANRDQEMLSAIAWGRIVLDEAQFIKNPMTKQSQAVRAIAAGRRVALTGTPVENRLSELWSIMDFLNPGYLGKPGQFRKRFAVPIERHRDANRSAQLRGLVRPFVLRRVKTDPTVVADLPEKLETKEFTHLTPEQAHLYENCVKRMLGEVEQSEGIHRRGLVLAALIKLKQICNHPSQMLKDHDPKSLTPADPSRSGKCIRLMEMMHEVIAEGDQALVFTQFRQMGHLLSSMLRHEMGRDVLFLHGGTPQGQRQKLIDQFQEATGKNPILVLSLKAGGVGLNLTAATHVFHFDRWWNPAVENQATDRAYRIGQTRTVQVHKFVVRGTLEERIDEMIESKTELAENIIGHGERWLTELDTDQLRDLLTLRADAVGDEGE